jgi:hypothetical protein
MIAPTPTRTRFVHFAMEEVSAIFTIPRKTKAEASALFWTLADEQRARQEAELEKLMEDSKSICMSTAANGDMEALNSLSAIMQLQFKYSPQLLQVHSSGPVARQTPICRRSSGMA